MKMQRLLQCILFSLAVLAGTAVHAADTGKPAPQASESGGYRLAANDAVRVTVFGEEDMSTTARIGKDGAINMPLVGLVKLSGQTVRDAARTMEARLREYLVKPQVAIAIVDYSKRRFTILGQVNKPGTYEIPDESSVSLLEAVGMAGGYSRIANPKNITRKRVVNGQEKTTEHNATKERFQVLPGDTIVVGERWL